MKRAGSAILWQDRPSCVLMVAALLKQVAEVGEKGRDQVQQIQNYRDLKDPQDDFQKPHAFTPFS
jgi:hypothetical protein